MLCIMMVLKNNFFLNLTVDNSKLLPNLTNNVIRVHENGNCAIGYFGAVYTKVKLPEFSNNNVKGQKLFLDIGYSDMGMMGDLYDIGGRVIVRYDPAVNGPVDCCVLIQIGYQNNMNDTFVAGYTMIRPPSTDSGSFIFASLLLILVSLFF